MKMRLPFGSKQAREINTAIAETMYFAALTESHALAVVDGPYESMYWNGGAPISRGILQQDMWPGAPCPDSDLEYDWADLRAKIQKDGVRNSLLISHPPTASTSNIMGNYESFEAPHSNVFTRKTKNGEFLVFNSELVCDLKSCGLWTQENGKNTMRDRLFASSGSIQSTDSHDFSDVPLWIRNLYKTITEVSLEDRLQMIVGRAHYVCQSSSNNVHLKHGPGVATELIRYVFRAHACGLKTGVYYTRVLRHSSSLDFAGVSKSNPKTKEVACTETECTSCSA
jgi:ribonucleoside-diphosphate reductase alpha chain